MNNILEMDTSTKSESEIDEFDWSDIPCDIVCAYNKNWITYDFVKYLKQNGFFTKPASLKYHGAYVGGLYEHSCNVAQTLMNYTTNLNLQWQHPRSPFLIGMFHDLCKMDNYQFTPVSDPDEFPYKYNKHSTLKGHGDKSIMMLSQFFKLTEEEVLCIRYHMGAYETDDWNEFDRAIRKYPNVLYTHTADMYASKVLESK